MIKSILAATLLALVAGQPADSASEQVRRVVKFQTATVWGQDDYTDTFVTSDRRLSVRLHFLHPGMDEGTEVMPSKMMSAEARICNKTVELVTIKFEISGNARTVPDLPLKLKPAACVETQTLYVPSGVKSLFFIVE